MIISLDISVEVANQNMNEGDTASFACQATGTPIPNISWYFNGAPLDKNNTIKYMISDMSLNLATKNNTLTIVNVLQSDNGTYTCEAANFASTDISSGALNVNSKSINVHTYSSHWK